MTRTVIKAYEEAEIKLDAAPLIIPTSDEIIQFNEAIHTIRGQMDMVCGEISESFRAQYGYRYSLIVQWRGQNRSIYIKTYDKYKRLKAKIEHALPGCYTAWG